MFSAPAHELISPQQIKSSIRSMSCSCNQATVCASLQCHIISNDECKGIIPYISSSAGKPVLRSVCPNPVSIGIQVQVIGELTQVLL